MKVENQVCSIQLAKKLKELGISQKSIFTWEYLNDTCFGVKYFPFSVASVPEVFFNQFHHYAAFTVSELGEMLPAVLDLKDKTEYRLTCYKFEDGSWATDYQYMGDFFAFSDTGAETLADAMAKMLIYLIENNLMEISK